VTAALVALVLSVADAAPATAPNPPLEVLEAGTLDYDVVHDRGVVTGGVVLRRGLVTLRAERAQYDARTGEVDASGSVLLTEPGRVIAASAMHAVLDGPLQAHDVVGFMKDGPLDLSRCRTLEEGRSTGRNRLTFGGRDLSREPPPPGEPEHLYLERARVTLCDCGAGPPSWEIRAHSADVVPGKRAILWWPVFYVTPRFLLLDTPVPVLALPAAYLPLGERQTGLLMPQLSMGGMAGFGISQPLFITLGRSWDATVTADYVFGPTSHAAKGPGTSLELRWAPTEGMEGKIKVALLHSEVQQWSPGTWRPPGWNRIALSGSQEQRISDSTRYRLDLQMVGDPLYLFDFTSDALLRAVEYQRSAFAITHRTDDLVVEGDASYLLPLGYLDSGSTTPAPFGFFGTDLSTFHRLPSVSATMLPVRVEGPVQVSGTLGVARFAPLRGATGDEGADGVGPGERTWSGAAIDAGERDGRWNGPAPGSPGERLAATRALARVELRAPMTVADAVDVEPWVAGTATAYAFEAALDPRVAARGVAGLALSTRVGRTFGEGTNRLRHEIEPRVEWRGGTGEIGSGVPSYAYDEFDVALPQRVLTAAGTVATQRMLSATPGTFSQLQLSVRNRLVVPTGATSNALLYLTVGQDLDASGGTASETWVETGLRIGLVGVSGTARFRAFGASMPATAPPASPGSGLDTFTELSGAFDVGDGRGDNLHGNFIALGAGGSPRLMAGLEPFFDPRPFASSAVAMGQVGATAHWRGASFTYDAFFTARDLAAPLCPGKSTAPHVYQHMATMVWDSPCHCWKAGLSAIWNECDERQPRIGFIVDFSAFGAAGTHF
jgi:LPS-assembly protein